MLEYKISSEIESIFKRLPEEQLRSQLRDFRLPEDRDLTLGKILTGKIKVHIHVDLDIKIYALKKIFPNSHDDLKLKKTTFSSSELLQYDPAKNGQNIMKHGISFREASSFSTKFGTLIVPFPEVDNERRVAIFSDILIDNDNQKLLLPLETMAARSKLYTFTVAQQLEGGLRFISSRFISKTRFSKTIKSDLGRVRFENDEKKSDFLNRCIAILRHDLFE